MLQQGDSGMAGEVVYRLVDNLCEMHELLFKFYSNNYAEIFYFLKRDGDSSLFYGSKRGPTAICVRTAATEIDTIIGLPDRKQK